MKIKRVLQILCLGLVTLAKSAFSAGLLTPTNSNLPALEIKDHAVKVVIEDGYAITTIEQIFYNPHSQDLEAIYSFPVPDKAAVSEFTMWINGKPIHGEVLEKKKARELYEEQKAQNKNAGLTEKNMYKTFEMSVYPVVAGQETKVRLSYIQPAHVDSSIGRYVYPLQEGGVDEEALAFWTTNEKVTGKFSFDLVLRSGYPVASVRLPNHPGAQIIQKGDEWQIHLDNQMKTTQSQSIKDQEQSFENQEDAEKNEKANDPIDPSFRLNTDIVVYYRHAENLPGAVDLVAYKEASDKMGTFMLTVTPGIDLKPIQEGRNWIFVLDISGSMQGKYAVLAEGVSRSLKAMTPKDRFRIILFNNSAKELTPGFVEANPENVKAYMKAVTAVHPEQGTNLYEGLQLGLSHLDSDRTNSVILVTDGVTNTGQTEQKEFVNLIKKYDIRLFTFIMGNSANQPLLQTLTRVSNGFAVNVSNSDDIIGKIVEAQSKVNFEAFHGAELTISGIKTADLNPTTIGSLYRGQQLIVVGHYFGNGMAEVTLSGKISGEKKVYQTKFEFPDQATENPEIERLWAYATIEELTREMDDFGENSDIKQSVIDLGIGYGLVTDYTSMVIVEEEVFQQHGIKQQNKQRLQKEQTMQEVRSSQPIKSHRVDSNQPMFSNNRPTFTGGAGAIDPGSLLILSPLLWGLRRRKNQKVERN